MMGLVNLQAQDWIGGTGSWFNPDNWSPTNVPSSSSEVFIGNGGIAQIFSEGALASYVYVTNGSGLTVSGGSLEADAPQGTNPNVLTFSLEYDGTLIIQDGGNVTDSSAAGIFYGTATVDGVDSSWINGGQLSIGNNENPDFYNDVSSLTIQNSGLVSDGNGQIDGNSTVTVQGNGSTWENSSYLTIGDEGGPGILVISNGGAVFNTGDGELGYEGNSGTVTVDGNNSEWDTYNSGDTSGDIYVGFEGPGSLMIQNGGDVSFANGYISQGDSGTVTVDGAESAFESSATLYIGMSNSLGSLTIQNGGYATADSGVIGSNGIVTVEGVMGDAYSALEISNTLAVLGGYVTIQNGGNVVDANGAVTESGTVTVSGTDSGWFNDSSLYIGFNNYGYYGPGDMTISGGGYVSNADGIIDYGGSATVTGTNSFWLNGGNLEVGDQSGGSLTIQDDADVEVEGGMVDIASQPGSSGVVQIGNGGSAGTLEAETLQFGNGAGQLIFDHTDGDYDFDPTNSGNGSIVQEGSGTTVLTADSPGFTGSTTVSGGDLVVEGILGSNNSTNNGFIGGSATGTPGTMAVEGNGAWITTGGLYVGDGGEGNLVIQNGGDVSAGSGYIGFGFPGDVLVDGKDSALETGGNLYIGYIGNGDVTNQNGGIITVGGGNGTIHIGATTGSGVMQIGNGGSAGTLRAGYVQFDSGTGRLIFNFTDSDYLFSPIVSGNGSLTKLGSGVLILEQDNTYAGNTFVNAGTLQVNNAGGSATGSGAVNVASGATLSGDGTIGGPVTMAGGAILAPGNNTGVLTIDNNFTSTNSTIFEFMLGTNGSQVDVSGNLVLGGVLNITNAGGFTSGTYTLFTYGGNLTLNNLSIGSAPIGPNYVITNTDSEVDLVVELPHFASIKRNGNTLMFSGSGGVPGNSYKIVSSADIALPLPQWTMAGTGQFDANGNFTFTITISTNSPSQFYMLQLP